MTARKRARQPRVETPQPPAERPAGQNDLPSFLKALGAGPAGSGPQPDSDLLLLIRNPRGTTGRSQDFVVERLLSHAAIADELEARRGELRRQYRTAYRILNKHRAALKQQHPEITGYGVQLRTKRGLVISPLRYVITIVVNGKYSDAALAGLGRKTIPSELGDEKAVVPVKIISRHYGHCRAPAAAPAPAAPAPAPPPPAVAIGGASIAADNALPNWGTLGIVLDLIADGRIFLTCEHVVHSSSNVVQFDDPKPIPPLFWNVGTVLNINGSRDCASITPNNPGQTRPGIDKIPSTITLNFLTTRPSDPTLLNSKGVWFVGAASPGITSGVIIAPQVDRTVEGQFYPKIIEFGSVAGDVAVTPGDSGSVLLAHRPADSNTELTVIGLVFAEWKVASTHGLAIPFWDVASKLGLTVSRPVKWQ